jgi:hypothetical protein
MTGGMTRAWCGFIFGTVSILATAPAIAQTTVAAGANDSMFTRDRNISVAQRPHVGYEPQPVKLGGFTGLPKLELGVEQNDNIYAVNTAKTSDTIFLIDPEFDISSDWSRNALQGFARGASRQYSSKTSESTTDWQLGGSGRLDLGHGALTAGGDAGQFTEPRTAPDATRTSAKPIRYYEDNVFVSAQQEFNRVRLTGRVDYQNLDYQNGTNSFGARILQDDRDHNTATVSGKAEYAVSPDAAVFVDAAYNDHRYNLTTPGQPSRNSTGDTVNVGANFDMSHLVRGEVELGYQNQSYSSGFGSVSGLSALGRVEWFPTELTTVTLSGSRNLQDAQVLGAPSYTAQLASLQADHELLRNLIISGRIGFEDDDYNRVSRKDSNASAYVAARYLMNRLVGLTVSYTYLDQTSSGTAVGPKYKVNRVMASTTLQF